MASADPNTGATASQDHHQHTPIASPARPINITANPDVSIHSATGPATPQSPLALASSGMTAGAPPASPSSANRFGIALGGLINRANRPRGFTLTRDRGLGSPGDSRSPAADDGGLPSPAEERAGNSSGGEDGQGRRTSYFPSIMRQSRRRGRTEEASSGPGEVSDGPTTNTSPRGRLKKSHSHHRALREPSGLMAGQVVGTSSRSSAEEPQIGERSGSGPGGERLAAADHALHASTSTAITPMAQPTSADTPIREAGASATVYCVRLVPHLDSTRSLHFQPVERKVRAGMTLKVGRFTDRGPGANVSQDTDDHRIAFKSKVVSRGHADIFTDTNGAFFIKDTKSSSGTFLNHIRLSGPGNESRPFPLRDGDVLQLGVDYQGGTEEMYRCVKMRVELNRDWQKGHNNFNKSALAQLKALGGVDTGTSKGKDKIAGAKPAITQRNAASIADCCICLFSVTVCQALFIAPCSHVYHYKCIRPLLQMHHPGFACPLCRTFADLEADVETEEPMYAVEGDEVAADGEGKAAAEASMDAAGDDALLPSASQDNAAAMDAETPGIESTERQAHVASGSRRPSIMPDDVMTLDLAGDSAERESSAGAATLSQRRPHSVIMAGPEGVGVPFNVTPIAQSRPASVRSVGVSPMSRRGREPSPSSESNPDDSVEGGAQAAATDQDRSGAPRLMMSGSWDDSDRRGHDEDSEMADAAHPHARDAPASASTASFVALSVDDPTASTATVDVASPSSGSLLSTLRAAVSRPLTGLPPRGDEEKTAEGQDDARRESASVRKDSSEGSSSGTGREEGANEMLDGEAESGKIAAGHLAAQETVDAA